MLFLAAEGPNEVHLPADINEVIWGSLAFFVLLALLIWKAWPPMKNALHGRTERIRTELAEAEQARIDAEAALHASTADLPDVEAEADRLRSEAVETAARVKADMIDKARADADALKERAAADIENGRRQALADLREEVARLTRGATEEVVIESLDDATHAELIDSYINQVSQAR